MKKYFAISIPTFILAFAMSISVSLIYANNWTGPTAPPPQNNVAAPINVSSVYQVKPGDLGSFRMRSNAYCDLNGENCITVGDNAFNASCPTGQAITSINSDGQVTCSSVSGGGGGTCTMQTTCASAMQVNTDITQACTSRGCSFASGSGSSCSTTESRYVTCLCCGENSVPGPPWMGFGDLDL